MSLLALLLLLPQGVLDSGPAEAEAYGVTGELAIGQRFVGRRGNPEEFEAEQGLDSGLFLRSFRLEGERQSEEALLDSFELYAEGLGNREESLGLSAALERWRVKGRYDRTRFSGTTTSDEHPFDIERRTASLSLERDALETRAGLELSWTDRSGLSIGTRSVNFGFVEGFPRLTHDRELGARGHWDRDLGWAELSWNVRVSQLKTGDELSFTLPAPAFPGTDVSEDFSADTRGNALGTDLRLTHQTSDGLWRFEGQASLERNDQSGGFVGHETGFFFDPSLPFIKDTTGDLTSRARQWSFSLAATRVLSSNAEAYLRLVHEYEDSAGHVDGIETLDELMGGPPSVTPTQDLSSDRLRSDTVELGSLVDLTESASVDLSVSVGRDALTVLEQVQEFTTRAFDGDLTDYGVDGSLDVDLTSHWDASISAGYGKRPTETSEPGPSFTFKDQRSYYASGRAHWRPDPGLDLTLAARHEALESQAFDANEESERLSLFCAWHPGDDLSTELGFSHTSFDLSSDTVFLFVDPMTGTSVVPTTVTFNTIEHTATGALRWQASPRFRPALTLARIAVTGDSAFDLSQASLQLPYSLEGDRELGLELSLIDYDPTGALAGSDYEAGILSVYLRQGF